MVPATTSLQGNERDVIRVQDLSEISNCLQHNGSSWTGRLNADYLLPLFAVKRKRRRGRDIILLCLLCFITMLHCVHLLLSREGWICTLNTCCWSREERNFASYIHLLPLCPAVSLPPSPPYPVSVPVCGCQLCVINDEIVFDVCIPF